MAQKKHTPSRPFYPPLSAPGFGHPQTPSRGPFRLSPLPGQFRPLSTSRPRPPHADAPRRALGAPSSTVRGPGGTLGHPGLPNARVGPLRGARPPGLCPAPPLNPPKWALRAFLRPLGSKYAPQDRSGDGRRQGRPWGPGDGARLDPRFRAPFTTAKQGSNTPGFLGTWPRFAWRESGALVKLGLPNRREPKDLIAQKGPQQRIVALWANAPHAIHQIV